MLDLKTLDRLKGRLRPVWIPQAGSQQAFLASKPIFEVLYEGTRGPGKTDALIMDFCQDVGKGFGSDWKGVLFRRTFPELGDVIAKSKKWIPQIWPRARFNEAAHTWSWPTGEMLLLRHFKRDDDYWSYHGHAYPWIGWEELTTWAMPGGFLRMQSCCRSTNPLVARRARVRSTTNPYGPGHNWVKHRYRLPAWRSRPICDAVGDDGKPEPPRMAIHGNIRENQILLKADPSYIDRIRAAARNKAELAAWLDGSWDIVAGGMFDDMFDARVHVVAPFRIPHSWRIDRSFDWGSSAPFSVGWWAQSDGGDVRLADGRVRSTVRGDLFRIAEWYGWNGKPNEGSRMLASKIAEGIVEREKAMGLLGRVKAGPADGSIFDSENGNCIAVDMLKRVRLRDGSEHRGVQWVRADKSPGSRKAGWEKVREALNNALPNEDGSPRERPGLYVFKTCDQWQRTVPVLPRDDKDPDDVDTDAEDHIADETRYRVYQMVGLKTGRTVGGH